MGDIGEAAELAVVILVEIGDAAVENASRLVARRWCPLPGRLRGMPSEKSAGDFTARVEDKEGARLRFESAG